MKAAAPQHVCRTSISLPEPVLRQLDRLVAERGFESRSQAITEMIHRDFSRHRAPVGDRVMTGTITLVYDHTVGQVQAKLAAIQHRNIREVISSLRVLLERNHLLELILVQGPAVALKRIADEMISCKGVRWGNLNLASPIMPPLHPFGSAPEEEP